MRLGAGGAAEPTAVVSYFLLLSLLCEGSLTLGEPKYGEEEQDGGGPGTEDVTKVSGRPHSVPNPD